MCWLIGGGLSAGAVRRGEATERKKESAFCVWSGGHAGGVGWGWDVGFYGGEASALGERSVFMDMFGEEVDVGLG